jgi:BlaI family penicillinase repressor
MAKKRLELTEGEWMIMQAVWDNEPCAAPTIQEALEKITGWSYSTVKTMMDRMVEKRLLKTQKIRNLIIYISAITIKSAQHSEIKRTMRRAFGGLFAPMMQFLVDSSNLSKNELDELEAMIKSQKEKIKKEK